VSPVSYELGFIPQKTAFSIVTAVKTSNLTQHSMFAGSALYVVVETRQQIKKIAMILSAH
jgi:hypothetical protein